LRAVVDRIEGAVAVLLVGERETLQLPVEELPPGTREGAVLTLLLRADPEATCDALESTRARIARLKDLSKKR
jgi:hypothetical protein